MVRPPKNMQPEAVDLGKAGRAAGKAFEEDSFRNYMARKIEMQRKQFGLELPPIPRLMDKEEAKPQPPATSTQPKKRKRQHVTFADGVKDHDAPPRSKKDRFSNSHGERGKKKKEKKTPMSAMLKRLKRRHGSGFKRREPRRSLEIIEEDEDHNDVPETELEEVESGGETGLMVKNNNLNYAEERMAMNHLTPECNAPDNSTVHSEADSDTHPVISKPPTQHNDEEDDEQVAQNIMTSPQQAAAKLRRTKEMARERPDLLFIGVVVMVNGYTNPDTETIQRLLHEHGGDLEKYETSRITHIIAEHLSTAKANIYKRMRRPTPIVHPSWIVDSVKAQKRLPHGNYLIQEVKDDKVSSMRSFFKASTPQATTKLPKKKSIAKEQQPQESPKGRISRSESGENSSEVDNNNEALETLETNAVAPTPVELKKPPEQSALHALVNNGRPSGKPDDKYIRGKIRTVGTDPTFLESFFNNSRLSFIGSYKQRMQESPKKQSKDSNGPDNTSIPKQRFVFHADMDCFFAAVVLRHFPQYQNKPVAISHFGKTNPQEGTVPIFHKPQKNSSSECATCNYEARKYGIQKGMFLGTAKQLCPNLIILPYDFEGYEEVSEQVASILQRYASEFDGEIEQVSCDESYLELFFPKVEGPNDPHQLAGEVADRMRREILETTRCTATIGVGANKFLSKLATDRVKPNRSFVVRNHTELLRNLKLKDLHGIGWRTEPKLAGEGLVSVQDVWDLGEYGESELCRILGQGLGKKIWAFCKGEDDRPVKEAERKSIGAECNYGVRFDGTYGVDYMIEGLAKEVQKRMEGVGVRGSQVTLKLKQRKKGAKPPPKFLGHGSCHNLSKSVAVKGGATREWKVFAELAKGLFTELNVDKDDVRGMGIMVTKLDTVSLENANGGTLNNRSIKNWFGNANAQFAAEAQRRDDTHSCDSEGSASPTLIEELTSSPVMNESPAISTTTVDLPHNPSFSQIDSSVLADLPAEIRWELGKSRQVSPPLKDESDEGESEEQMVNLQLSLGDENDAVIENSDEVEVVGQGPFSTQNYDDVALPPLSQIHLSQVNALPSPLKKKINARIAAQKSPLQGPKQKRQTHISSLDGKRSQKRICQVSVKRMFRLAEVKAGKSTVDGNSSIAVDELQNLPLKLQLQVANNDNGPLGKTEPLEKSPPSSLPRKKSIRERQTSRTTASATTGKPSDIRLSKSWDEDIESRDGLGNVGEEAGELAPGAEEPDEQHDFFLDNVVPLSLFLDENQILTAEAVAQVSEYLCLCVKENRLPDVVKLLHNIKNRDDDWSRHGFGHLFRAVDDTCHDLNGYRLDQRCLGLYQ